MIPAREFSLFFLNGFLTVHHRKGLGCAQQIKYLTSEHTTLRRHAASLHAVRFQYLSEVHTHN